MGSVSSKEDPCAQCIYSIFPFETVVYAYGEPETPREPVTSLCAEHILELAKEAFVGTV